MARCHPTRVLRDEHRLILRVVDALEAMLGAGPSGAPPEDLQRCVTFFRLFTDACHHGKEEDLLFGALGERGFSRESGPLAMLLDEHREGRVLVGRMAGALERLESGVADAWSDFADAGRAYAALLRRHIDKEDGGVFDLADDAIPEPACRRLCEAYDIVCARRFEGRTVEELEELADGLVGRYARPS